MGYALLMNWCTLPWSVATWSKLHVVRVSGTPNDHHFLFLLKGIFYPSTFCLPDDQVLMEGQPQPIVLQEDVFDEVHWAAEQVSD